MRKNKKVFTTLLLVFLITMIVLPFVVSFNEVLTKLVERLSWYVWVQDLVVPVQTRLVGVLVRPFQVSYVAYNNGMVVNGIPMKMTWNCLGWQSILFLIVSLVAGFKSGDFTKMSKIELVILGLVGIFWVNLLRITFTVLLAVFSPPIFRIVFHDYLAAFTTIGFLLIFWWFAYSYVLVERRSL